MQTITLYRYVRPDGGVTVSPSKPEGEFTQTYRLVADEGTVLTNGSITATCVDTDTPENWSEVATQEDLVAALTEFGVTL